MVLEIDDGAILKGLCGGLLAGGGRYWPVPSFAEDEAETLGKAFFKLTGLPGADGGRGYTASI